MKKAAALLLVALGAIAVFLFLLPSPEEEVFEEFVRGKSSVRLLFVGDIFFDRDIRRAMRERGDDFPLSCAKEKLLEYDVVVGNLEGPITPYESKSLGSASGSPENYIFTFPTTTADILARHNILLVNLGNNHIGNFGREGIEMTRRHLVEFGVHYFGSIGKDTTIYRSDFGEEQFSFVGFNEFGGVGAASTSELILHKAEEGRIVFVYAHWGEEYAPPPPRVVEAAHAFIDAGAESVFGSHPHVVLPKEAYKGKAIYYSLGNFLFDQYWSEEVSTGLAVEVAIINGEGIAFKEHKTVISREGRVCFAD